MTEDQFSKLMEELANRRKDHDLLVEINTIVRLNHDNYEKDKIDISEKIGALKKIGDAAHRRLDNIYAGVMVSVGGLILTTMIFFAGKIVH